MSPSLFSPFRSPYLVLFTHTHSLSLLLFSWFIPCLFALFFPSLFFDFLSCLVSLPLFHAKKNIKISHLKGSSHQCLFCFVAFLFLFSLWNPLLLSLFSSMAPALVWCFSSCFLLFSFLCWFCVCCFCLFSLLKMSEKTESYPTSHLTARPLKILFQKSTNFLIHKDRVLEVSSQNPIFVVLFAKFHSCFWGDVETKLRVTPLATWELPH